MQLLSANTGPDPITDRPPGPPITHQGLVSCLKTPNFFQNTLVSSIDVFKLAGTLALLFLMRAKSDQCSLDDF